MNTSIILTNLLIVFSLIGVALIVTRRIHLPGDQVGVWVLAACFGNTGFIAFMTTLFCLVSVPLILLLL